MHNFREKVAHLRFEVRYTAGKYNLIADTLLRTPAPSTFNDDEPPAEHFIVRKTIDGAHHVSRSDPSLKEMFEAAMKDEDYKKVVLHC